MFYVIKKSNIIYFFAAFLFVVILTVAFTRSNPVFDPLTTKTLIIDPGHGGNDPGAIGVSGTSEKDINLAVSLRLKEQAEASGFRVVMTRESDIALYDDAATNKKRSDLQNRKRMTEKIPSALFISVHMNKFEQSSVRGAQTFYAQTEESKLLAESIQKEIQQFDTSNKRVAMKTPKTVYILQNVNRPSVLIEGGFLSNPSEERSLLDKAYQEALAAAILDGIKAFLDTPESIE